MNKRLALLLVFAMALALAGCSGVSQKEYDAVIAERDELLQQVAEFQDGEGKQTAVIAGDFTAVVREKIPSYVIDDTTLMAAVVTCFQDGPFVVYLGEELINEVEVGEAYTFVINEKIVEVTELFERNINPAEAIANYNISVESVRTPTEAEYGLEASRIYLEAVE